MDSSSQSQQIDYQDILSDVDDEANKAIIHKQIQDLMANQINNSKQQTKKPQRGRPKASTRQTILDTTHNLNLGAPMARVQEQQQQDYDYQENYKRQRDYQTFQPPKYKIIGYNKKRMPIFKMTDLYLTDDPQVRNTIQQQLNRVIYGGRQVSVGFSSKFDNRNQLAEVLAKWQNKEEEDFGAQRNNMMNQAQLQQTVVNIGQNKQDYFLYVNRQSQEPITKNNLNIQNGPLNHPNFLPNLWKSVDRMQNQYKNIQEFQSDEENQKLKEDNLNQNEKQKNNNKNQKQKQQNKQEEEFPLWGTIKDSKTKDKNSNNANYKSQFMIQKLNDNIKDGAFTQQIIKDLNYVNPYIISDDFFDKTKEDFNRIQLDLADPNFFLPKLNATLEKRIGLQKFKKIEQQKNATQFGVSVINYYPAGQSQLSQSIIPGNKGSKRHSALGDGRGDGGDDDHETLQQRINKQTRIQGKQVINHTPVATRYQLVKFTTSSKQFQRFHRYSFPFQFHFKIPVKVQLVRHKPSKLKGTDLSVNSQYVASYTKFISPDSLSLANGQFIMVEYIQQNPLIMSSIGMCQRLSLQVSKDQMLDQVKRDIMINQDFQETQNRRDNNLTFQSKSFKEQSQRWRKNIRQTFGDIGKVYLWDSRKEGKVIGTPQGPGVAIMQSKLATVPVVKKKNNQTDFLLVRDNDKWVIRRIDNLYVSGQVQPKAQVFNPDSRNFNTSYMSNYQKAFIIRSIRLLGKVHIDALKKIFPETNEVGIKKTLKSLSAYSTDGKQYTINNENLDQQIGLSPQDVCLYQSMQHSLYKLQKMGITHIRHTEKIKQILSIYFKRYIESLQKFAIGKMIKQQLQLTSWYLTESFIAFKNGTAKIDLIGHADPTNGHGGYSFIKKPQKQRAEKEQLSQKAEKAKVSGTDSDLRKLKTKQTQALLLQRGYTSQQLKDKQRWDLVKLIRQQQGTQYARQQRQTKIMKLESEKKEISKIFNRMLKILNDQQELRPYQYGLQKKLDLQSYMKRERGHWQKKKNLLQKSTLNQKDDQDQDD